MVLSTVFCTCFSRHSIEFSVPKNSLLTCTCCCSISCRCGSACRLAVECFATCLQVARRSSVRRALFRERAPMDTPLQTAAAVLVAARPKNPLSLKTCSSSAWNIPYVPCMVSVYLQNLVIFRARLGKYSAYSAYGHDHHNLIESIVTLSACNMNESLMQRDDPKLPFFYKVQIVLLAILYLWIHFYKSK